MITCKKCGHNEFMKMTVLSCNSVPPIFNCVKCGMSQNIPRTYLKESRDFLPINTKENYYISFLRCLKCGKEDFTEFELDSMPDGWTYDEVETYDPNGDVIVKRYAYCSECAKDKR